MPRTPSAPPPAAPPAKTPDSPEVLARVHDNMVLVEYVIRTMRREIGTPMSVEDMRSYGQEALLRAARSFDPSRGVPFKRWANLRIRGAIIDGIRTVQLPRRLYEKLRALEAADQVQDAMHEEDAASPPRDAEAADQRLTDYLSSMATALAVAVMTPTSNDELENVALEGLTPEEQAERAQLMAAVKLAMNTRPEAERRLLELYYLEGHTFEKAAAELGLSKSWASRLHTRAIDGVTKELKKRGVTG